MGIMNMKRQLTTAILLLCGCFLLASCSGKNAKNEKETAPPPKQAGAFIVMEKVLADTPGRPRTTMKIVIPDAAGKQAVSDTISKALDSARKQDPALKAAIIWAYRSRAELNGSNYTLGKLEWSADGMDFNGAKKLDANPKIDVSIQ
jgi:hypothetical protein